MTNSTSEPDEGLPPPDLPYHFPPITDGPKPVPDSTGCAAPVKDLIAGAVEMGHEATERWNDEIPGSSRAAGSDPPTSPAPPPRISGPRDTGTPGYFTPEDRRIDHIGDGVKGTVGAIASFFTHPVGTAVHDIYGARINAWQQAFRKDHASELRSMSRAMGRVDDQCKALRNVVHNAPKMDPRIAEIMKQKTDAGNRLLADIEDCLRKSTPGADRDRLEGIWKDLRAWMRDRDARVAADRRDVDILQRSVDGAAKVAAQLDTDLQAAGTQAWTMWISDPEGQLLHASPESVIFAAKLRTYLMATRDRIDEAVAPS